MKFTGRVTTADDAPLAEGVVEMVGPSGVLGRGKVVNGSFSLSAEPTAIWGLLIDGNAVVAAVASVQDQSVDVGEIVLFSKGVPMDLFHAKGGLAFGAPLSLLTGSRALRAAVPSAAAAATPSTKTSVSFGNLVGGVALQLGKIPSGDSGLQLQDAKISVKGVPTTTDDAVGLTFPSEEVAATGVGLSELTFTLKPKGPATEQPSTSSGNVTVPDLKGYTRDLAVRKLAKLGLLADTVGQIVKASKDAGRVLNQSPAGGAATPPGAVIRLFVGKSGAT